MEGVAGPIDRVFGAIQQAMRQKGFAGMDQLLAFIETVTCDEETNKKCQVFLESPLIMRI